MPTVKDSFAQADSFLSSVRAKAVHPIQSGMAMAAGGMAGMSLAPGGVSLAHHAEQYRHYQGYPYTLITTIARRLASQEVHVARVTERDQPRSRRPSKEHLPAFYRSHSQKLELLESHQFLDVIRRPNPIMTHYVMMLNTYASLELTGKAFWWMWDDPELGEQIWPLPASWCEPVHEDNELYAYWRVTPPSMVEPSYVPAEDMAYFYHPDPGNPLEAKAPLQALARSVLADESVEECQRRAFANGVNPGLALIVGRLPDTAGVGTADPPVLTQVQRQTLITQVKRYYRGVLNFDEPLILDGLIKDAKRINPTPRELDFLQSSVATQKRLSKGWNVSDVSMGELQGANRASAAVADEHLCLNSLNPRAELVSQVLTIWVAPRYARSGEKLIAYVERAHAVDKELQLNQYSSLMDRGAVSINEARQAVLDLPPIKGGNVAYVAGVAVPIEREDEGGSARGVRRLRSAARVELADWGVLWAKEQRVYETRIRQVLVAVLRNVREEFTQQLAGSTAPLTAATVRRAFDVDRWATKAADGVREVAFGAALFGASAELLASGAGRVVPDAVAAAASHVAAKVGAVRRWSEFLRSTRDLLWQRIRDGYRGGDTGPSVVTSAVNDTIGERASVDAARGAARTESIAALNGGQYGAQQHLGREGRIKRRRWEVYAHDDVLRETHRSADGQEVAWDEQFRVGGHLCWYPGDPELPAEERCNCRCRTKSLA